MTIEECTSSHDWFSVHGPGSMPAGGFTQIRQNRARLGLDPTPTRVPAPTESRETADFCATLATIDRARALGIAPAAAAEFARVNPRATAAELEAAADQLVFSRWIGKNAERIYARLNGRRS